MMDVCRKLGMCFEGHRHTGKQALEAVDRARLGINPSCSVALEKWGLARGHRNTKLWDYLVVAKGERLLAIEVHPATAGDAKDVIEKKKWAAEQLRGAGLPARQWWWIPSGRNTIPKSGQATRLLAKAGILVSRRVLDETQLAAADS